jgi:diguanylate cyclase (GGDEF)-like protein
VIDPVSTDGMTPPATAERPSPNPAGTTETATGSNTVRDAVAAFGRLPLAGSIHHVALGCLDAVRSLVAPARLVFPTAPVPLVIGDSVDGLHRTATFASGAGELWTDADAIDAAIAETIGAQLDRIWALIASQVERDEELDGLRFRLAALQQVTHTLAEVRETDQTERLALDNIREIFFAWWAVLYRARDEMPLELRAQFASRGEVFPERLPSDLCTSLNPGGTSRPVMPPAGHPARELLPSDVEILVPFSLGDAGSGLIALGPRITGASYGAQDLALIQTLVDASAIALRNADLIGFLRTQAIRDTLTGCQNRRGFDEILQREFTRSRRYGRTLSLMLFDLDHFKQVNDDFGHDAGDHVLRRVGRLLQTAFRSTDTACRPGGEEFAMIFPETPRVEAVRLAERFREELASMAPDDVISRRVTASFGVAAYPDDAESIDGLIRAADRALYRAKAGGRNRVVEANGATADAA